MRTEPIDIGNGTHIKLYHEKKRLQNGNKKNKILCYAGDAILIAQHEDDLQRLIHRYNTRAKTFNVTI